MFLLRHIYFFYLGVSENCTFSYLYLLQFLFSPSKKLFFMPSMCHFLKKKKRKKLKKKINFKYSNTNNVWGQPASILDIPKQNYFRSVKCYKKYKCFSSQKSILEGGKKTSHLRFKYSGMLQLLPCIVNYLCVFSLYN